MKITAAFNICDVNAEQYNAISFDIFDTLIFRCIGTPKRLFYLLEEILTKENKTTYKGFANKRIKAEQIARLQTSNEEITLDEIYLHIDIDDGGYACQKEKELEIDVASYNPEMKALYKKCVRTNKKIYFCSDMYLDNDTIRAILEKCGYTQYQELILSSEKMHTKMTGHLYQDLINSSKVSPNNTLHIGDNYKSDYINARKNGLHAVHYKRPRRYIADNRLSAHSSEMHESCYDYCLLYGDMPRVFLKDFYWEQIGNYVLGNFLYGFTKWLIKNLKDNNYDHVFFLSRDGWIMLKTIEAIADEELISKCSYLYASRRSLVVPSLNLYEGYESRASIMFWKKHFTLKDFVENFGLDYQSHVKAISTITSDIEQIFERAEMFNNDVLRSVYELLEKKITENSKKEHESFISYLKQNHFEGKVAIVDSGWFGNLQNALQKNVGASDINADINGYYIGIKKECKYFDTQKMHGYLFFGEENYHNQELEIKATAVVEALFSHDEGSTKCYRKNENTILPVLKEPDTTNKQHEILEKIQAFALVRCKFLDSIEDLDLLNIPPRVFFDGFVRISLDPNLADAWNMGKFVETKPLKNTGYYLMHPSRAKRDVHELDWKLGQLKRIIKIPLDYVKLYDFIDR